MSRVTTLKKKTQSKAAARKPSGRPSRKRAAPLDFDLVLFISGASERSRMALANIKAIANEHLKALLRQNELLKEALNDKLRRPQQPPPRPENE